MSEARLESIVIAGGGAAGWLAAAALAAGLPRGTAISLIDAPADEGPLGAALATAPEARALHGLIGLRDDALARAGDGSFKLGVRLENWPGQKEAAFLPYGPIGEGPGFHHYWARAGAEGALGAYALASAAAAQMRFAAPGERGPPLAWGLHLDAAGYAGALRQAALARGVRRLDGAIASVEAAGGAIAAVNLDNGDALNADLFIDCTGTRGVLIGALGDDFSAWRDLAAGDRMLRARTAHGAQIAPYARAVRLEGGWMETIPLYSAAEHAFYYASAALSDEAACAVFNQAAGVGPEGAAKPYRNGARAAPWRSNCVALGAAGAAFEPLHGLSVSLLHRAVQRLVSAPPRKGCAGGEREEFNRLMGNEAARVREILALMNGAEPPAPMARKQEMFARRGRVPLEDEELFTESEWAVLLAALGHRPARADVIADGADPEAIRKGLARMKAAMEAMAAQMPPHKTYLDALHKAGGR